MRSQVEGGNHGKIVAIDIETGAFEVADKPISDLQEAVQLYQQQDDTEGYFDALKQIEKLEKQSKGF